MGKVVVVGATGMLGRPVVKELLRAGHQVTAVVRDIARAQRLLPPGISLVKGDLRDPQSLRTAFQNEDVVYFNLSISHDANPDDWCAEREGLAAALKIAIQCGVKRVAYLSSIIKEDPRQSAWWVFQAKRSAVDTILASGLEYTIFSPSCFMETLTERQIRGDTLMTVSNESSKNFWISGRDYGLMVTAGLFADSAKNKIYWVQGPEALTLDEVRDRFLQNFTKINLRVRSAPLWLLKVIGWFDSEVAYTARIMDSIVHFPEPFQGEAAWRELHRPTETVSSFAKRVSLEN